MMDEIVGFLEKRGFVCAKKEDFYDCIRNDGVGFQLSVAKERIMIEPGHHAQDLKDFSSREELESIIIELQGILSELKIIALKHDLKINESLIPYLEEILEELE